MVGTALPCVAQANKIELSSYLTGPFGVFDRLVIKPQSSLNLTAICNSGSIAVDQPTGIMYFCRDDGTGRTLGTWQLPSGEWVRSGNDVFLPEAVTNQNLRVGIGTTTPEFRLTLDNDGGMIATGALGTGATIPVFPPASNSAVFSWYPRKAALRAVVVNDNSQRDTNIGTYSVAFGANSTASGLTATIGGGSTNTASGQYATILSGSNNIAAGDYSVITNGQNNTANGVDNRISGNRSTTSGDHATVAGGDCNAATATGALVAGGQENNVIVGLPGTPDCTPEDVVGEYSVVGGGFGNTARGNLSVIGGGQANTITSPSLISNDSDSVIGGGSNHSISGLQSVIMGGTLNQIETNISTIGGGSSHRIITADAATIGGGSSGHIEAAYGTVIGGASGRIYATAQAATSLGSGEIRGAFSVIAGGVNNDAHGDYSWAGGKQMRIHTDGDNVFAWGFNTTVLGALGDPETDLRVPNVFSIGYVYQDNPANIRVGIRDINPAGTLEINRRDAASTEDYFMINSHSSSSGNIFKIDENGNIGIGNSNPQYPLHFGAQANNAHIDASGNIFTLPSSRKLKKDIKPIDHDTAHRILEQLAPVTFNYVQDQSEHCVGFIAEDVPQEVASPDRRTLQSLDITAALTVVAKDHEARLNKSDQELKNAIAEVRSLKRRMQTP